MNYLAASDRWIAAYGQGHHRLIGLNHYDLHPDMPQRWRDIHRRGMAGETLRNDEELSIRSDGSQQWLRWAVLPWRDDAGEVGGIIMSAEDITERKRAQEELRESEQRYAAIFDNAPFAIVLTRASDRVIVGANPAYLELVGRPREEVVGSTSNDWIGDAVAQAKISDALTESGTVRDFECSHTPPGRTARDISLNLDWVTIGGVRHVLTTIRDITELKRAQTKASMYERAKELDRLKTELFANVSHELRTPLALIRGPLDRLLVASDLPPDARHQLEVVRRNARTLGRHVEDLLVVARIEAGQIEVRRGDVDVAFLVRFVAGHFEVLASEQQIAFAVEAPESLVVMADPDLLQRMVLNLLSNAFKFTPTGGRVRVSLRSAASRFSIEVADSGPGIPDDQRSAIFDRFHQIESGSTRRFGGTGLGLAIAKELVELHEGRISVAEAPEGGALFVVDLPRAGVASAASAHVEPVRDLDDVARQLADELRGMVSAQPIEEGEGQLVLVVEDNPEMNAFICAQLSRGGYRCACAYDGVEGIAKAIELTPDLVLTDIMMPEKSGDELVRTLRERPELDSMPIVVLTAKADEDLRISLLRSGAQDWLAKPFAPAELDARVGNLLARKRAEERNRELQRQIEEVTEASREVAEAVASLPDSSVRAVLQTIALKARELTGAEYAAVGLGRDPEVAFDPWVFVGVDADRANAIGHSPRPIGTLRIDGTEAIRLRDLRAHGSHRGFPPGHPEMNSFLGVAIPYRDRLVGTLYLANKRDGYEFTEQDQRIVEILAGRVGVAIETARLYGEVGRERTWLQAVIDQMPEVVVLMDVDGHLTLQNQSAKALACDGRGRDPFGNPITLDLRYPSGDAVGSDHYPNVRAIRDRESTYGLELVVKGPDREVPVVASAAPICGADGELAGATMMLQDVTTLKELERLREEWASIVAHDLQQPVNSIVLTADLLLREQLSDASRDRVLRVRSSTMQLSRMISDLSDAAQLETRRIHLRSERLDLGALVHEVVERVPGTESARVHASPEQVIVQGDAGRLEQVLANLLSNAVKYGASDAPIDVTVQATDGMAQVSVTNQGEGISADELPHLFDRFMRTRAARASATKGSGLGLYIAKGLIDAHGGRIWAESPPGATTTFRFTLPLA